MELRHLAHSDLRIGPLMFGGNVFGWTADEARSFELLDAFVARGFNAIDTADIYSNWVPGHQGGESEAIIGKWMKSRGNRSRIVIATKVGMQMSPGKTGLRKDYIFKSVEESLQRLQTDYIDLYQAHQDDPTAALEETLSAFDELKKQGKVRLIGASNYTGARLQEALKVSREKKISAYQTLQPRYNLYDREDFERDLEPVCREFQIGALTYSSLASGFLTGKYRSVDDAGKSVRGSGVAKNYVNEKGLRLLKALDEVAAETKATPTQVSLAWLLHKPVVTAPIVSATNLEQLNEVLGAADVRLTPTQIGKLDATDLKTPA